MYLKELRYYFTTPVAYIVIGLYLLTISLFLWVIPGDWNIPQSGYSQADGLFVVAPWLLLFLCPALTMRLFAEERQLGTWSLLLTKPLSLGRIVAGKYFAAWTVVLFAQIPTIIHYFLVYYIAQPVGNIDSGAFFGAFIGLLLLSALFCALGIFAATLSKSQIISFVIGICLCFVLFYGFDLLVPFVEKTSLLGIVKWMSINEHYMVLSSGVIDLRDVVYFISSAILWVLLSILSLKNIKE